MPAETPPSALGAAPAAIGLSQQIARNSRVIVYWALFSRVTGFLRVATLGAVLGATYFSNLFQTVLLIPYIACELIGGSMIVGMLVPSLVKAEERGGTPAMERLAGGFFGSVLPVLAVMALCVGLLAPLLLSLVTATVDDPEIRQQQVLLGWPLLLMLLPQILLYSAIGTAIAAQNSRQRFGLAAGAPSLENIVSIAVLALYAYLYGTGEDVHQVSLAELALLGFGTTAATACHAALQWWGARRVGITLRPWVGWRDPEVRAVLRNIIPSGGASGLTNIGLFLLTAAAGKVPGGAVAIHIAIGVFNLPIALAATPLAMALQPLLARLTCGEDRSAFTTAYLASQKLALFMIFPAAALLLTVPGPIAAAVTFGEMNESGVIVAAAIAGIGLGIVGEAAFAIARSAAYARFDPLSHLYASGIRLACILAGISLVGTTDAHPAMLYQLALSYALAAIVAAGFLHLKLFGRPLRSAASLLWLARNAAIALLAALPSAALALNLPDGQSMAERLVTALGLTGLAALIYLTMQFLTSSREFQSLVGVAWSQRPLPFARRADVEDGRLP